MSETDQPTSASGAAPSDLLPQVYDEMRRIAGAFLAGDRDRHTLQATALVNEAYIKLAKQSQLDAMPQENFVRLAARVMRNVLVDYIRAGNADKRGGDRKRVALTAINESGTQIDVDVLALNEAIEDLTKLSERKAKLIELRFFGGLTEAEAATCLGISRSEATVQWRHARAWLQKRLQDSGNLS
ncbi:MAG: ECF-type sigma factor [Phycisphaerae bacterium]